MDWNRTCLLSQFKHNDIWFLGIRCCNIAAAILDWDKTPVVVTISVLIVLSTKLDLVIYPEQIPCFSNQNNKLELVLHGVMFLSWRTLDVLFLLF